MTGSPLRVLVVDDEAPARALLLEYLAAESEVEVVGECANGFEAVKAVAQHQPDLLLLDIQMPKLDGFEVLELLEPAPAVVFVTAHDEHALRAFEVHAVDYLLKPVEAARLTAALQRVRGHLSAGAAAAPAAVLRQAARSAGGGYLERIATRAGTAVHVFPVERLDYAEAQDDFVVLVAGGIRHRKQQTLNELETLLDPARFVRIHRSYLLNLERLARVELYAKDSRVAILADGAKLPLSRAGYARLQELL